MQECDLAFSSMKLYGLRINVVEGMNEIVKFSLFSIICANEG